MLMFLTLVHSCTEYVLDLNDVRFSEPLIRQFVGNVCVLSVQKFSSNVIEKVRHHDMTLHEDRNLAEHLDLLLPTVHPSGRP